MKPTLTYYPGQFATTPDLLHVTIPRLEIVAEMASRDGIAGESEALNDICLAVAVVAEAIAQAQTSIAD